MASVKKARQVGAPSGEAPIILSRDTLRFVRVAAVKLLPSKSVRVMPKGR